MYLRNMLAFGSLLCSSPTHLLPVLQIYPVLQGIFGGTVRYMGWLPTCCMHGEASLHIYPGARVSSFIGM